MRRYWWGKSRELLLTIGIIQYYISNLIIFIMKNSVLVANGSSHTGNRTSLLDTAGRTEQILHINNFIASLGNICSLDEFAEFRNQFSQYMKEVLGVFLEWRSESFLLAFEQWSVSKYQPSSDEDPEKMKESLRILLIMKNRLYRQVLLPILLWGKLDTMLSIEERNDIVHCIQSGVFEVFDDMIIPWLVSVSDERLVSELGNKEAPHYGWIQNQKVVWYDAFSQKKIVIEEIWKIKNPHLRVYLERISNLLASSKHDYVSWVDAETHESAVWADQTSKIWFVSPMEDYIAPGFVEPELYLFLKDTRNQVPYSEFYNLSEKYFGQRFGMDKMTCTHVETLLEWWDAILWLFVWKAFPNDPTLSKSHGNNIILRSSPMELIVENAKKQMLLLFPGISIDFDVLKRELLKEVTYHEFGHSLFIKWHPSSLLEEAKASLFYYLHIFDANKAMPFSESDRQRIVLFIVMDSLRMIERLGQPQYAKYTILMQSVLTPLFSTGLVRIIESGLELNVDKNNFNEFLEILRDLLFKIKELYLLDTGELSQQEKPIIEKLENDSKDYIDYIARVIGIAMPAR
jgi:hypothetical protein